MLSDPVPLFVFAAGLGTRMRPLTETVPKPLIKVAGRSLLDHALDAASDAHVTQRMVNAHYLADQIEAAARSRDLTVFREVEKRLETGGGLKNALRSVNAPLVFTMNSDCIWTGASPTAELAAAWDADRMDALLLLQPSRSIPGHTVSGDFDIDANGRPVRGGPYMYTGAQLIRTAMVKDWPDDVFSLNSVWDAMEAKGRLFATVHDGDWLNVETPELIPLAEDLWTQAHV